MEASADPSPTEIDPEKQKIVDIPTITAATAIRASDFAAHSPHFVLLEVSKTVEGDTSHLNPLKLHHGLPQHAVMRSNFPSYREVILVRIWRRMQKRMTNSQKEKSSRRARKKFTSTKSISSSSFDQSRSADVDAKTFLEEVLGFCKPPPAQHDISFLTNIAGETGKKLSSLASNIMKDLQDRVM
ncbi:hypothetical protein ACFX2C_028058 [Malus domestica]